MKRPSFIAAVSAATILTSIRAGRAATTEYNLGSGPATLFGTLSMPASPEKPPVVLIIAGSGPTDRNGNAGMVRTDTYRLLAQALASDGIASVRYDKRGVAESAAAAPSEADLRFETYASDAADWIAKLRADARFGPVGIAGHSEGSLLGMLAAQRTHVDAFISLEGAGFPAATELRRQLAPKLAATPDLAAASERILTALSAGATVADVPQPLIALYRPAVQPYLISWFRYDPRVEIAKVAAPATIVAGTYDVQVPVEDARALAAAQPHAKLVIVERMSHVLKEATDATLASQVSTVYADPALPLDSAVPKAIVATFKTSTTAPA